MKTESVVRAAWSIASRSNSSGRRPGARVASRETRRRPPARGEEERIRVNAPAFLSHWHTASRHFVIPPRYLRPVQLGVRRNASVTGRYHYLFFWWPNVPKKTRHVKGQGANRTRFLLPIVRTYVYICTYI